FNIAKNETVNFKQPSIDSITLNRVVGNESSVINGALNANGQVWILNSNGILFGKDASVNTSGILATTAELSDKDFNAENYNFKNNSSNSVVNLGTIEVSNSGSVILAASEVRNSGTIKAIKGKVHLSAASEYTVNLNGNSLVNLIVSKGVLDAMVENSGTIIADGGEVYLTTNAVNELLKGVVNNTGIIEANSLDGLMGKVELFAHGGEVQVGGTITAKDGFVETSGKDFKILEDATIKAGEWLIDPVDVTIDATLASTIETALDTGDVTIETDSSDYADVDTSSYESGSDGDINVNSKIEWSTVNKLTLDAANDININAEITASSGQLALYYGDSGDYNVNAKVNLSTGANFFTKKGTTETDWTVVTTAIAVEGMSLTENTVLGDDVDASTILNWTPISTFSGKFDGLGHTISNLTINKPDEDYVGLFGRTSEATIKNIGVVDVSIIGQNKVGGLVGYTYDSTIENSYSIGNVTGVGYAGGLVGYTYDSTIENSYSIGNVIGTATGNAYIGGLVGFSYGSSIENTYALGDVSSKGHDTGGLVGSLQIGSIKNSYSLGDISSEGYYTGGLVGFSNDSSSTITNSYASGDVEGKGLIGGLIGYNSSTIKNSFYDKEKNTATMSDSETYGKTKAQIITALEDLAGTPWKALESDSSAEGYQLGSLPYLENITRNEDISKITLFNSGLGTDDSPYAITNWTQLQNINNSNVLSANKYFDLSNSIDKDTSDYTNLASSTANDGKGWNPLGEEDNVFRGTFDGQNNTISDLTINRETEDFVGLFGFTNGASIKNIGIVNATITGQEYVGGLVGFNNDSSTITNSYASGDVSGDTSAAGGLVGLNYDSTITNSYASATVSGIERVGGLVGFNNSSTITNSYATGSVSGSQIVGGLLGGNSSSTIENSYASGNVVKGIKGGGGLVGVNDDESEITNSFYDKTENPDMPDEEISGVTGKTTKELSYGQTFKDASWDIVADSAVKSATPVIKYDSVNDKYYWAIAPLALSYTLSTDQSKTYDGETKKLSDLYKNVFGKDYSFITGYKFQEDNKDVTGYKNAGTYEDIKVVLDGENTFLTIKDSRNVDGTYVIDKKALSVSNLTVKDKVYNGTTSATLSNNGTINKLADDSVTLSTTATFNNKNVEDTKTVNLDYTLSGDDASNYSLSDATNVATSAKITAKDITAITDITASNKTYDGTTDASLVTSSAKFTGIIEDDTLNVATSTGKFSDKNAEDDKTVNITGLTLGGTDSGNYNLKSTTASTKADISKRDVTINASTTSKIYDGTTNATVTLSDATPSTRAIAPTGIISEDTVSITGTSTFSDKNVGTNKTVTTSLLSLSGTDAGNYNITNTDKKVTSTANITAKDITVSANDLTKVYGQEDATLTYTTDGLETGDKLTGTLKREAGEDVNSAGYAITQDTTLTNSNYTVTFTNGKYTITPKALTVTNLTVKDKTYDGTTSATLLNNGTIDKLTGDNVVFTTAATFNNKNVEDTKTVNLDYTLSGDDASNYTLADATSVETNAKITAKDITAITGITAENRTYDGTTDATLKTTNAKFTGMITTDELSVGTSTGTFVDKNVAENKIVNITNLTLSGDDKDNYNLKSSTVSTKATINKADATVTAASDSKTYTGLEQTVSGFTASGLVNGETIDVLDNVTASASGINAGTYTAIASGSDENYNLTFKDGSLIITPKAITVSADDLTKVYGSSDETLTYSTNGLETGDTLTGTLKRVAGENVAEYAITQDTTLANSNYTVTFTDGKYTITPKAITVSADDLTKVYGSSDETLTYSTDGLVGEDTLTGTLKRVAGENVAEYAIAQDT
ncbi:YDG domain-containing protein, partial [Poseidonibacter antarcticus]|uniref:YDG domain-containing protein n=1 Tax=Poseidonibacter antarcticus TaxID=2478538 RepID=UPI000EF46DB7